MNNLSAFKISYDGQLIKRTSATDIMNFIEGKDDFVFVCSTINEAEIKLREILPYLVENNQIETLVPKLLNQIKHLEMN